MINDLINGIKQDSIRSELLNENFDTIICYPGAGADIYPCAVIERIDNEKLKIPNYKDKSILYLFCDPEFSVDESSKISSYGEYIRNICGKKNIRVEQLLNICKESKLFGNAYAAYSNIEEMLSFTRIDYDFGNLLEGYYYKIVINGKICHILMLTCKDKMLWEILEEYNVNVDGAFLWDVLWSVPDSMANVNEEYLPNWIIDNRAKKFVGWTKLYEDNRYNDEIADLILKVRGVDGGGNRPDIYIKYRLGSSIHNEFADNDNEL